MLRKEIERRKSSYAFLSNAEQWKDLMKLHGFDSVSDCTERVEKHIVSLGG